MEFDPSSSSHAHLSVLRPLTTQSAELAKLVETIGKDTTSNDEDSTSRLRVDSSPKGVCVCVCAQHKYTREWDVQKMLYTAQNVRSRVGCAKSALYGTKCTLESEMCKSCHNTRESVCVCVVWRAKVFVICCWYVVHHIQGSASMDVLLCIYHKTYLYACYWSHIMNIR